MKAFSLFIVMSILLCACTKNNLSNNEKVKIINLMYDRKMDLTRKEMPIDACFSSFFSLSDYKVDGDISTIKVKMSRGGSVLFLFAGTKSLATDEGCNKMKDEFSKLKGDDAKFDIVEMSWNNKTGKGISQKPIATKVD